MGLAAALVDLLVDLRDHATAAQLGHLADDVAQLVTIGSVGDPGGADETARLALPEREVLDGARVEPEADRPPEGEHGSAAVDWLHAQRTRRHVIHVIGEHGEDGFEVTAIESASALAKASASTRRRRGAGARLTAHAASAAMDGAMTSTRSARGLPALVDASGTI